MKSGREASTGALRYSDEQARRRVSGSGIRPGACNAGAHGGRRIAQVRADAEEGCAPPRPCSIR